MDYLCTNFGDFSFSRFGFNIVQTYVSSDSHNYDVHLQWYTLGLCSLSDKTSQHERDAVLRAVAVRITDRDPHYRIYCEHIAM